MFMDAGTVVIRGGGDIGTGVIQKFFRAGFRVLVLEAPRPTAIRRSVSLCEAVYAGRCTVEDVPCERVDAPEAIRDCWDRGIVPLIVDPQGATIPRIQPDAVVDAILAKRNLGTNRGMAAVTVGIGPGFEAGRDVDAVIETQRGHDLGRLILRGAAQPNTGVPGEIGGRAATRVIHAPASGAVRHVRHIGDWVEAGETLFTVGDAPVRAVFTGRLRGLIREGLSVPAGMKVADVDPRGDVDWRSISDKARCIGGAALEAVLYLLRRGGTPCAAEEAGAEHGS